MAFAGDDGFRKAFLQSIAEYNSFGVALGNPKYQVSADMALQLYGFKVACVLRLYRSFGIFWNVAGALLNHIEPLLKACAYHSSTFQV